MKKFIACLLALPLALRCRRRDCGYGAKPSYGNSNGEYQDRPENDRPGELALPRQAARLQRTGRFIPTHRPATWRLSQKPR